MRPDDASTLPDLLAQIVDLIRRFTADGAYDHRSIYDRVGAAGCLAKTSSVNRINNGPKLVCRVPRPRVGLSAT